MSDLFIALLLSLMVTGIATVSGVVPIDSLLLFGFTVVLVAVALFFLINCGDKFFAEVVFPGIVDYKREKKKERKFKKLHEEAQNVMSLGDKNRTLYRLLKPLNDLMIYVNSEKLDTQVKQTISKIIEWMLAHNDCTDEEIKALAFCRFNVQHREEIAARIVALPNPNHSLHVWVVCSPEVPRHLKLQAIKRIELPDSITRFDFTCKFNFYGLKDEVVRAALLQLLKTLDLNSEQLFEFFELVSRIKVHEEMRGEIEKRLLARELTMYVEYGDVRGNGNKQFFLVFRDKDGVEFKIRYAITESSLGDMLSKTPLFSGQALIDEFKEPKSYYAYC